MTSKEFKSVKQRLLFAERINDQAERLGELGFWEWDLVEKRMTYCSEGHARILEMTVEETLATHTSNEESHIFIHPDDRQHYIDASTVAREAGTGLDVEYRVITAKGRLRHVHEISEIVKDDAGALIQSCGIVKDITNSKQQQEKINRSLADARRAETLAKLGTYVWNWEQDTLESCSEEFARVVGSSLEQVFQIYTNNLAGIATVHPDDRDAFWATETAALARGEGYAIDYRQLLPNGDVANMRLICEAELNDLGKVIRTMGSIQDVTEQVQLQEQLRHALKNKAIGQLTGGVAHDFNNLLAVILGNLELAINLLGESSPANDLLTSAFRAGKRGAMLTRRLLAFARKQALRIESVDLQSLILEMKELLQTTVGENIRVEIQDTGRQWLCETDASQFEIALVNLAVNARDAMPDGGSLHIAINSVLLDKEFALAHEAVTAGSHIRLSVSDTGVGMPLDVQEQAFDPFFTTKEVGEGSGLGLSMVYGFLKQCHGHVSISSEPGEGAVVEMYLPHISASGEESLAESTDKDDLAGDRKILVVEDDLQLRELAVLLLADLGYETIEAADASEALQLLGSEPDIALLFSDVLLPGGMTGVELAEEAWRSFPDLKVLLTSGYTRDTAQRWGTAGYELLEKPYSKAQLSSKLRRTLAAG